MARLGERRTREFHEEIKRLPSLASAYVGRNVGRIVGRFDGGSRRKLFLEWVNAARCSRYDQVPCPSTRR
jgi:hypothetical protein